MPAPTSILGRILTALGISRPRRILPTWMGTAEIRELGESFWSNAVFSARTTSAKYLTTVKDLIDGMLEGEMDLPLARLTLKRTLGALGYTPAGGFGVSEDGDSVDGVVPPAIEGQIEDLSSERRLELVLRTQEQLMQGAAQKALGLEPLAIRQFPAWELVRVGERRMPRDWEARWTIALANLDRPAPVKEPGEPLRLIAMKGDPIWKALGASDLFDDALDVDHPPFAFSSGMGWAGVGQETVRRLGITGPDGETVEDVLKVLPRPKASALGIDPEVLRKLKADLKLKDEQDGELERGAA